MHPSFIFLLWLFSLHLFGIVFSGTLFNLLNIIITLIFAYYLLVAYNYLHGNH